MSDFRVGTEGRLSVWHIEDDSSNLDEITTALASTKDHIANVDFLLFEQDLIDGLGIGIEANPGNTPLQAANRWHRDLVKVSAYRLFCLARKLFRNAQRHRIQETEVQNRISDGIREGRIDRQKMKPMLASDPKLG